MKITVTTDRRVLRESNFAGNNNEHHATTLEITLPDGIPGQPHIELVAKGQKYVDMLDLTGNLAIYKLPRNVLGGEYIQCQIVYTGSQTTWKSDVWSMHIGSSINASEELEPSEPSAVSELASLLTLARSAAAAEVLRADEESIRKINEEARNAAETTRIESEVIRVTDEIARKISEKNRADAETTRADAEIERAIAEDARKTAETGRADAEEVRVTDETARKASETNRINTEASRSANEAERMASEAGRETAEAERLTKEAARETAEDLRAAAEAERITAETERAAEFESMHDRIVDELEQQIADIQYYIGYTDADIFGLEADFQNLKFTRLAGAANRTAGAMFDNINAFGGRRRCIVADDGVILAYRGEAAYTETGKLLTSVTVGAKTYSIGDAVQVMVYQPRFYYKVVPLVLDKITDGIGYHMRKARYYVSDTPRNGFRVHPAFIKNGTERPYVLIGAYEGCLYDVSAAAYNLTDEQNADFANDKLSSIANAKPASGLTQNLTRRNCGVLSENRGTGWSQTYAAIASATQLLMVIEYAAFNTQAAIGSGVIVKTDDGATSMTELTGQTAQLGNTTGMATGTNGLVSVSYRGEENPWGNIWKFVDGINVWGDGSLRGGVPYIADNAFAESKNTDNYKSAGFTLANAAGYISAFGYGNPEFDWLFMASETAGNNSTPVGDCNYVTANLNAYRMTRLGAHWAYGAVAGGFCWGAEAIVSTHHRAYGGRLAYVPAV